VTVEALSDVLYSRKWAVCSIIELRPAILLAPYELVQTLQLLADVLGISSRHTGELFDKLCHRLRLIRVKLLVVHCAHFGHGHEDLISGSQTGAWKALLIICL
jgi:hypothetical protein